MLDDPLLRSQLRAADVVVLNKADLADADGLVRIRAAVVAIKPAAVVVETVSGRLPIALLFPADPDRPAAQRNPGSRRGPVADRFETSSWTANRPVSLPRFQQAIGHLSPKLARAKGFFETMEEPGRQTLFQLAGGRATLAAAPAAPAGVPCVRIVFISEVGALSTAEIERVMGACLDPAP